MERNRRLAYAGLVVMTLIIGLSFIFVKIGLSYANPYDLLAHRFSVAFLLIVVLRLLKVVKIPDIRGRDWIAVIGLSLFYPVLCFAFQALGMQYSTASEAGIIFAFLPLIMLVMGWLFLKERTSSLQKLGVAISVLGVLFIFLQKNDNQSQHFSGVLFLFLSVLSMVSYFILGKRVMKRYDSLGLTAIMITVGFVIFNAISLVGHFRGGDLTLFFAPLKQYQFTLSVIYLGVLSSVLTSFLTNYALIYLPASVISIFSNLNPVIAVIGGVLFLGESLLWFDIVGAVAVLTGVLMVLFFKPSQKNV